MCQVLTKRARDQGSRPPPSLLAEPPGQGPPGTGAQLAPYVGLAPVTRRSDSSIRGEYVSHSSNKRLKRTISLSTFASLPTLWPRQPGLLPAQTPAGERHNQAVLALAHRRILTLHAMIRNNTPYNPQPSKQPPTAA
jgi:transposase IS116/IS110/IS902 family protein